MQIKLKGTHLMTQQAMLCRSSVCGLKNEESTAESSHANWIFPHFEPIGIQERKHLITFKP